MSHLRTVFGVTRLISAASLTVSRQITVQIGGVDRTFRRIDWLGISSLSKQAAVFHIDNLMLGTQAELDNPPPSRKLPAFLAPRLRPQAVANEMRIFTRALAAAEIRASFQREQKRIGQTAFELE